MTFRADQSLATLNARSIGRLPGARRDSFHGIEEGMVAAELDIRPDLIAPNGYLHAATVIALADTACGYGCLAHLPTGATLFTTIELKSNFLGTVTEGTIACIARPARHGLACRRGCHDRRRAETKLGALPLHANDYLAKEVASRRPARGAPRPNGASPAHIRIT
jgi:uncharacterized protein (TIGR00369 family)